MPVGPSYTRIHIVGGPGSGKTTLARRLAGCLSVPCFELDVVGYVGGAGAERPVEARLADVAQIAALPAWVTEGIFLGWTTRLFEAASTILWLDLPWSVARWRIITRHIMADLRGNNKHHGWKLLFRFLQWCQAYYDPAAPVHPLDPDGNVLENRPTTAAYITNFTQKVARCQHPYEVNEIRKTICQTNLSSRPLL